jgi:hypothetical protein
MQTPANIVIRMLNKQSELAKLKTELSKPLVSKAALSASANKKWKAFRKMELESAIDILTGEITAYKWVLEEN